MTVIEYETLDPNSVRAPSGAIVRLLVLQSDFVIM